MFFIEFALLLAAILVGVRIGGVALGLIGGLGVAVQVFVFRMQPGTPPIDVIRIILAVVTAAAALEAAGGLQWLVQQVEKVLRARPQWLPVLAPFASFFLTMAVGTGHAIYALFPIIDDVALRTKIRPERAMAMSSVASQMGITASPIAAAIATYLAFAVKAGVSVTVLDILRVTVPAGILGVLAGAIYSTRRGKELYQDPEFLKRMEDPDFKKNIERTVSSLGESNPRSAKSSVFIFFGGVFFIIILALMETATKSGISLPSLIPRPGPGKPLEMGVVVQYVMLAFGALILFTAKIKSASIAKSAVFNAGMIAVVAIFGIAWMSDTFVLENKSVLVSVMGDLVKKSPWTYGLAIFVVSAFVKSQAATLAIMLPLGHTLGVPAHILIGLMPASYAYFFWAFYPSDLAAINMDRSGTTRIGKYLLNHSFMVPGLIGVAVSTCVGYFLAQVVYGPLATIAPG